MTKGVNILLQFKKAEQGLGGIFKKSVNEDLWHVELSKKERPTLKSVYHWSWNENQGEDLKFHGWLAILQRKIIVVYHIKF